MNRRQTAWLGALLCGAMTGTLTSTLMGQQEPAYSFNILGVAGTTSASFLGRSVGNDMLPYTDDDGVAVNNIFGLWGAAHIDHDCDGEFDPGEPSFTVGVQSSLWTAGSLPQFGVIYEAEDWAVYLEANGNGPNGTVTGPPASGDFEINDGNGWTGESNCFRYTNKSAVNDGSSLRAKGYLENADGLVPPTDPWKKSIQLQNSGGDCRRWYRTRDDIPMKGYLLRVADLPGLIEGTMPSLFGWEGQTFDLASYFKNVIGPLLTHPDRIQTANELGGPQDDVTHIMLLQYEIELAPEPNELQDCPETPAQGAIWGGRLGPSEPRSKLRVSQIMAFNSEGTAWIDAPSEGSSGVATVNLDFAIDGGSFEVIGEAEPTAEGLEFSTPGAVIADTPSSPPPIPPVVIAVSLKSGTPGASFQLVALAPGNRVVAYADFSEDGTRVHIGGSFDPNTGMASNPTISGAVGPGAAIAPDEFATVILCMRSGAVDLRQLPPGGLSAGIGCGVGDLLATVPGTSSLLPLFSSAGVYVSGTTVKRLLVVAPPGVGPFLPGDCNGDGEVSRRDIPELGRALWRRFRSWEPGCAAGCDFNGDGRIRVNDLVRLVYYLFRSGPSPEDGLAPIFSQDTALDCKSAL